MSAPRRDFLASSAALAGLPIAAPPVPAALGAERLEALSAEHQAMNRVRWGNEDISDAFGDRLAEREAEIAGTSATTMRAALVKLRLAVWFREQDTVPGRALLDGLLEV